MALWAKSAARLSLALIPVLIFCSDSIPTDSPAPAPSPPSHSEWSYVCYSYAHAKHLFQMTATQATDFSVLLHAPEGDSSSPKPAAKGAELVSARLRRYDGKCFFMRAGWWTYEVCERRRVRASVCRVLCPEPLAFPAPLFDKTRTSVRAALFFRKRSWNMQGSNQVLHRVLCLCECSLPVQVCPWHSVKQYHAENRLDGVSKVGFA